MELMVTCGCRKRSKLGFSETKRRRKVKTEELGNKKLLVISDFGEGKQTIALFGKIFKLTKYYCLSG